jgi:hypothetical protein
LDQSLTAISLAEPGLGIKVARAQEEWQPAVELCKVFSKLDPQAKAGAEEYCRLHATATRALLLEGLEWKVSIR